jgi:hypothetical protein
MSDTHEQNPSPSEQYQDHAYAGLEQFWNFEVERRSLRKRSYMKVSVGLAGLFADFLLTLHLMIHLVGDGYMGPFGLIIGFIGTLVASVSSIWLLKQGLGELKNTRALPPPHLNRSIRGSRHQAEGSEQNTERQLLEVIERNEEITPARAALQTSLTVDEAERLLSELAQKGHLDVRVEGSRLVYSL